MILVQKKNKNGAKKFSLRRLPYYLTTLTILIRIINLTFHILLLAIRLA